MYPCLGPKRDHDLFAFTYTQHLLGIDARIRFQKTSTPTPTIFSERDGWNVSSKFKITIKAKDLQKKITTIII